jgi:hypothetical protein
MRHKFSVSDFANNGEKHHNPQGGLLDPLHLLNKRQKPQVSSIPGVSVTERERYRVMIGDRIIATGLNIDDALEVAANSTPVTEVDS